MSGYILDASVAAKWFLPSADEPYSAEAYRVLEDYVSGRFPLMVPDLFWPELGNILWKAVRSRRISRKTADESILAATGIGIPTAPSFTLLEEAFAIASAHDRTVYDATYLALALVSKKTFLTADERLANAVAARFPMRWIGALVL